MVENSTNSLKRSQFYISFCLYCCSRAMPMHSNIHISIITLFFLLLPPTLSTSRVAKSGCQDRCGDINIPYPFGVGSNCSFNPYFDITCNSSSTNPQKAYLSMLNTEVIEINDSYIRVKYPNLVSACYDLSGGNGINSTAKSYNQSMTINLLGTPYTLSTANSLTAIGCDDMVLQSNGSWVGDGCSTFCADVSGGVGYCASPTSLGNGCCQARISGDGRIGFVGAELIDLSGNLLRKKLFPCSYSFIQESINDRNKKQTVFSYPLDYLESSTTFLNDNWASTTMPPVVRLGWSIGSENCSQAQTNSSTYACLDNKSVCIEDVIYGFNFEKVRGYLCKCVEGYEGNPYLPEGCQEISFSTPIVKSGCLDLCGELPIYFPFGVGSNCYKEPSFEIICDTSTNPPIANLAILNARIIELNSSRVLVKYPNLVGSTCYNLSDNNWETITKIEEQNLIINLSRTQYTLSDENSINAIGCDDMVVGIVGQENQRSIGSSCATACWDGKVDSRYPGTCPYASDINYYNTGYGCCSAPIPRGTTYLQTNLSDLSVERQRSKFFSCSYVFVNYKDSFALGFDLDFLNNPTAMHTRLSQKISGALMLDWRIGQENCSKASKNLTTFACQSNSKCVDFDIKVGGYLCSCLEGYQGNPYLPLGCQDIDECDDNTTNPCHSNSSCINTQGSFKCLCPEGYYDDGRKDGTSCIYRPETKTKTIILIGIGSGLGFLLILLMVFKLYKVLQKKKEDLLKEILFKQNGGLILQRQINALGKIKVFFANELEVATDHFNDSRVLGQGGQGIVYKGMLSDGKIVAIKKSKKVDENQLEQFINEIVILSQINHKNIVKLLGCCLETEVPLLVYEFMPNGTLFDLINDPNNEFPFSWNIRLKIASDIAGALAYLHSASSMPLYHRDIKSSNILLDEKYVVKVSDFGTSRLIVADQTHLTTMVKGTFGYLDPEYFRSSQFTEKSDVYSFGVVLVELLTRQRPISLENTHEERGLASRFVTSIEENDFDSILDPQVWEQEKKEDVILVARLAQRCLNLRGKMRPTMKELATELESYRILQIPDARDELVDLRNFEDMPSTSDIESNSSNVPHQLRAPHVRHWMRIPHNSSTTYKSVASPTSSTNTFITTI